jgi:hypothetical protein
MPYLHAFPYPSFPLKKRKPTYTFPSPHTNPVSFRNILNPVHQKIYKKKYKRAKEIARITNEERNVKRVMKAKKKYRDI